MGLLLWRARYLRRKVFRMTWEGLAMGDSKPSALFGAGSAVLRGVIAARLSWCENADWRLPVNLMAVNLMPANLMTVSTRS